MMGTELEKAVTWVIDDFSEKKSPIESPVFSSGGCEWYVLVHPKGDYFDDYIPLYLCVANPKSLKPGWKRRASLRFNILNQSGKELHRTSEGYGLFHSEIPGWGFRKALPLSKFHDKELLGNNTLIIQVYIKVVDVGVKTGKEMLDFRGFSVLSSQISLVSRIFEKHPNFAVNIKHKSKEVKSFYMKILLGLMKTVGKPPESFSESELTKAYGMLIYLMDVGFKLDWLKSKLDEVSLERKKKHDADAARVQELENKVKNLELILSNLKVELDKEKAKSHDTEPKVFSLEDDVSFAIGKTSSGIRQRKRN